MSHPEYKTNSELGQAVHRHLVKCGLETPMTERVFDTSSEKIDAIIPHFVVIDGKATIAYIPKEKVLGLSKINRIAEFFSKRPQVQERLTNQICETLSFITESDDVAVYIDAMHYCVKSRGIQDTGSSTVTLATKGAFASADSEVRREFLAIARS